MAGHPPSGTVTFLLTDLEGSTRMWEQDPEAMKAAMVRHDEILEKNDRGPSGLRVRADGRRHGRGVRDGAGRRLRGGGVPDKRSPTEPWGTARPLRARVGLHTDEAVIVDDTGYASLPINRCSRLMTAAHGGQIVVSGATEMLMRGQLPDGMELVDLGEHRLRDLGRPLRDFQLTHRTAIARVPPLRTLDSFPGKPSRTSEFVHRAQDEVSRVRGAETSRVVTVTGVGGVGKTRLALQVAADVLPRYRDGAWLVELAPVRDLAGVVEAVAEVFRLTESRSDNLSRTSRRDAAPKKQTLLVLDNCEHVLGAVARLVSRIERECPGVVVLATSREGMAIDGEQLIALPPLEVGEPGERHRADSYTPTRSDLFVERARQVKADFALNEQQLSCGRRDLPAPRRGPAGHRTGGGPGDGVESGRTPASARSPIPGACRWATRRGRAPRNASRSDRLVLRPAGPCRAATARPHVRCSPEAARSRPSRRSAAAIPSSATRSWIWSPVWSPAHSWSLKTAGRAPGIACWRPSANTARSGSPIAARPTRC